MKKTWKNPSIEGLDLNATAKGYTNGPNGDGHIWVGGDIFVPGYEIGTGHSGIVSGS